MRRRGDDEEETGRRVGSNTLKKTGPILKELRYHDRRETTRRKNGDSSLPSFSEFTDEDKNQLSERRSDL